MSPDAEVGREHDATSGGETVMGAAAHETSRASGTGAKSGAELSSTLGRVLLDRGWTLAIAESCTGGLLAKLVTDVPGSSRYLKGAVVAYANDAKIRMLGVKESAIEAHGAVSSEVAGEMATGVARSFDAEVAIAVTGIAGPGGASPYKPVGTVWFAIATPSGVHHELARFSGDRAAVRHSAAQRALELLIQATQAGRFANPRGVTG